MRLVALDEQIALLQHARRLLAAALWYRFDHPATDCKVMGAEIDRRLDGPEPGKSHGPLGVDAREASGSQKGTAHEGDHR